MQNNVAEKLSASKTALIEVLTVGFLMGVCASISATLIYENFKGHLSILYLGLASLLVWCIFFLSKKFTHSGKAKISVTGFLTYLKDENSIKTIPRYRFSEKISRYLESAFNENEALRRQWDKEPLRNIFIQNKDDVASGSLRLIREASEYYLIETLSMHLTDYFNKENYDKNLLSELSREDVPSILLSNRFMELFSAPMENRAVFDLYNRSNNDGIIIMSIGKNGAFYSRFDLVLPKGTKISRSDGALVIETSKFKLTISVCFDGTSSVLPINFEEYYLGLQSFEKFNNFSIQFKAEVEFKMFSSLRKSDWNYHAWLDSYFERIERDMSGEFFFKETNWETVATMIECGQKMPRTSLNQTDL